MLRWLHISDLHIQEKSDWVNYKIELFNKCKEIGKIDFVVVTGDFHDFSDGKSFVKAKEFLQSLVEELHLNIEEDLFMIPGNHDGTVNIKYKEDFILAAQKEPLNISASRLKRLLGMFGNYDKFVKSLIIDYSEEQPSTVHLRIWHDQIALIHCNSAIAAGGKTKENQLLDIDGLSNIRVPQNLPIFLLAHNSFFDLDTQQQNRVKDYIRNNHVCAYLCGDTHIDNVLQIPYGVNQNEQIPCIISYKSAPDPTDKYSRFGIIIGEWEKEDAVLRGWYWESGVGFQVDSAICEKKINMRSLPVPDAVSTISYDIELSEKWKLIGKSVEEQKAKDLIFSMKQFLKGYPCTWALAFSNLLVARNQLGSLKVKVKEGGIIALLGAGAEGKSTLLKQLCVQLYREGYIVLFHIGEKGYELPEQLPDNAVIVVDDPDDHDFIRLLSRVYEKGYTLLFAARRNEWNFLCKHYNVSSDVRRMITFIDMENVTDYDEASAFADCVMHYYRPDADKDRMIRIFLHNSGEYGFLYAAMLLAISDKVKFEEIAQNMIEHIEANSFESLELLGYVVLTEQTGASFTEYQYQSLLKKLSLKPKDVKSALELELQHKGKRYETRHPQISKLFYSIIFGRNDYFDNASIDRMKYDLLDSALNEYSNNTVKVDNSGIIDNILCLASFINEAQDFYPMIQRVVEELRNDPRTLQRIFAQIFREDACCTFAEKCYSYNIKDPQIMLRWAKAQNDLNGAGDYTKKNSARWIYRKACMNRKCTDSGVWLGWAQMENKENGAGDYKKENSALWIYHEACIKRKGVASGVWLGWAQMEKEENGAGDYTKENSALWIYREACINRNVSGTDIWLGWAQLEKGKNGAGDYTKENSALWIYHEACINRKQAESGVWLGWAQMEKEENGAGDYTKENSALWIYRKACINRKVPDTSIWLGWAQMEKEENGTGDYTKENSALWIYREACINRKISGTNIWLDWAQLEKEENGIGDYTKENSALWIYREACINRKVPGTDIWLGWAQMEKEENGTGDYTQKNSTLWIYHEACINRKQTDGSIWLAWAEDSILANNGEWTPLKIFNIALSVTHRERHIIIGYINCLMHNGHFAEAREELRKIKNKNYALSYLLIIEMVAGNVSEHDEYSTAVLVPKIKKALEYSNTAKYVLYIYYRFSKNTTEADRCYSMLDISSKEVESLAQYLENFLANCLRAYDHSNKYI